MYSFGILTLFKGGWYVKMVYTRLTISLTFAQHGAFVFECKWRVISHRQKNGTLKKKEEQLVTSTGHHKRCMK